MNYTLTMERQFRHSKTCFAIETHKDRLIIILLLANRGTVCVHDSAIEKSFACIHYNWMCSKLKYIYLIHLIIYALLFIFICRLIHTVWVRMLIAQSTSLKLNPNLSRLLSVEMSWLLLNTAVTMQIGKWISCSLQTLEL